MKFKLILLALLFSLSSIAQNKATITGVLSDKDNSNLPLQFANAGVEIKRINRKSIDCRI